MGNVPYKFKRGAEAGLDSLPVEDGSFILTKDTLQLYVDLDNSRFPLTPESATDDDIVAMFNNNNVGSGDEGSPDESNQVATTSVINGSDEVDVTEF